MRQHLRTASHPRWLALTAFVGILVVAFLLLGRWQLHRADTQGAVDARRDAAMASGPVGLATLVRPQQEVGPDVEWRAVTATGTYDAGHQVLVRNRTLQSTNGYYVAVPLRTAAGDLLVVRGWVPAGPTADGPAELPAVPAGTVTVTGRLRLPEPASGRTGLPPGQLDRIIPAQLAELTGRPTYDAWLSLTAEDPPAQGSAALQMLPTDGDGGWRWPISHTVYALQWFTFCVIAVVGWFVLLRRDVRDETPEPTSRERDATIR